jgi:putative chitinase
MPITPTRPGLRTNQVSAGGDTNGPRPSTPGRTTWGTPLPAAGDGFDVGPVSPSVGAGPEVTSEQLRAVMPNLTQARADEVLPYLNAAMAEADISTPKREAMFLAQLAHESQGLTQFTEYASGREYEGRVDLGNTQPGDGVRYRGRGAIQLTGRANYRDAGAALGLDLEQNPQRAADLDVAFRTSAWFWNKHDLNAQADRADVRGATRRINGGLNGIDDRLAYYARAQQVLDLA